MVVTRSMSGTTKKADTKVAVNHKVAERASKKTSAERQRASKKTSADRERASKKTSAERARKKLAWIEKGRMNERQLRQKAADLYVKEMFMPQYKKKHPGTKTTMEVVWSGYKEWNSLIDSDKDPYVAKVKKIRDEMNAHAEDYIMVLVYPLIYIHFIYD